MKRNARVPWLLGWIVIALAPGLALATAGAAPAELAAKPAWFQATEQALMDAIAVGDRATWERFTDESFVLTGEEGEVVPRAEFLAALRPLPPGLVGRIQVQDLTVQAYTDTAIVRYRAEESESVFGQQLAVSYRVTSVYRQSAESWKMVASHLSVVTRDPPAQDVSKADWPSFVGQYRLPPDGWIFTVELREGRLFGGRDPQQLQPLVPLAPNAFVVSGRLGEWIFVSDETRRVRKLLELRKFAPLVWSRIDEPATPTIDE